MDRDRIAHLLAEDTATALGRSGRDHRGRDKSTPAGDVLAAGSSGSDFAVARYAPGGTAVQRVYAVQDANYNVTALADASGTIVQRFEYDPYGTSTVLNAGWGGTADGYDWPVRFQGLRLDAATELYDARHRAYSPALGRWLQQDPEGYADSLNMYEAARSSPAVYLDPNGTKVRVLEVEGLTSHIDAEGEKQVKTYVAAVNQFIGQVKTVEPGRFGELVRLKRVTFDGKVFDRGRDEYIKLLEREAQSGVDRIDKGNLAKLKTDLKAADSLDVVRAKVRELAADNTEPWDQTIIGVHGIFANLRDPTGDVGVVGEQFDQAQTLGDVEKLLKGVKGSYLVVSCFNNPQNELETYSKVGPRSADFVYDAKMDLQQCSINFRPLRMGVFLMGFPDELRKVGVPKNPPTTRPAAETRPAR